MSTLTPREVIERATAIGTAKAAMAAEAPGRLAIAGILAGCYIALGATLSIVAGYGFPEATAGNPALQRLLSGLSFPIGLVLVVVLGAELFTGNNALLVPAAMRGATTPGRVALNWALVYVYNFIGSVAFAYVMVYCAGLTDGSPYREATVAIAQAKTSQPWLTVFVKGIGANWLVCLAVWLALSSKSLPGKVIGCWLPVAAFVALGYEHCIANMFFIPMGMMNGAEVSAGTAVWNNLIPATLGNIVGGAVLVGALHAKMNFERPEKG